MEGQTITLVIPDGQDLSWQEVKGRLLKEGANLIDGRLQVRRHPWQFADIILVQNPYHAEDWQALSGDMIGLVEE